MSPPSPPPDSVEVPAQTARLREILSASRARGAELGEQRAVPTGWGAVDAALGGGLARGALHEWYGIGRGGERRAGRSWAPPLYLAIHLAWQALEFVAEAGESTPGSVRVLWIGREVWPYPRALVRDFGVSARGSSGSPEGVLHAEELELVRRAGARVDPCPLIEHSLLVDAGPAEKRLWAVDMALRCPSVVAVVADGSRFDMAATRRLQLAAEVGRGLALVFRPPWEAGSLSAATTRWRVCRSLPRRDVARPCWSLELVRRKGFSLFGSNS